MKKEKGTKKEWYIETETSDFWLRFAVLSIITLVFLCMGALPPVLFYSYEKSDFFWQTVWWVIYAVIMVLVGSFMGETKTTIKIPVKCKEGKKK